MLPKHPLLQNYFTEENLVSLLELTCVTCDLSHLETSVSLPSPDCPQERYWWKQGKMYCKMSVNQGLLKILTLRRVVVFRKIKSEFKDW